MKFIAPGKLILSGEHAVVYGCPALALAIDRYVSVETKPQSAKRISFNFSDFAYTQGLTLHALRSVKARIHEKYQAFLQGQFSLRDILKKPGELAQFALGSFLESIQFPLKEGASLCLSSTIPIGCGMGSSAATIIGVLYAITRHCNVPVIFERLLELAKEAEHIQHGRSSGIDLQVSLRGGCLYFQQGCITDYSVPVMPLLIVNTGTPLASTGECVLLAQKYFQDIALRAAFTTVTQNMAATLQHVDNLMPLVKENQRLLQRIGVVPEKITRFIADIEQCGGAAKICGAGSVRGDNAGVIWVLAPDPLRIQNICQRYQYNSFVLHGVLRGVHEI